MADIPPRQQVNGSETIRMGQTEGLPHYDEPGAEAGYTPRGDAEGQPGTLARRQPENGDGAFAILKAFQDYMEHERQRTQRRTTTAVTIFSALLVAIVLGFAAVWISTMGRMQDSQTELMRTALAAREERQPAQTQTDVAAAIASALAQAEKAAAERAAAEKAAQEAETARRAEARQQAEAEAAKAFEERLAAERKKAADEAAAREAEVAKTLKALNETVEAVRRDNEALRKDNETLRAAPRPAPRPLPSPQPPAAAPATSPSEARVETAPQATPPLPIAKVGTMAPQITVKRPAPPKGYATDTLAIPVGENGSGQLNWHILLPSELPAQ